MTRYYIFPVLSTILLFFSGCSSTDTLEPNSPSGNPNSLTLTVNTPTSYGFGAGTRADDAHRLRITAKLYTAGTSNLLATVEELPTSAETTISFTIKDEGNYVATVFADYIAADATATDGHYPDKYYSFSNDGKVTALTENNDFFNNDNRDCFLGKALIQKGKFAVSDALKLNRATCKVMVAAPNDDVENLVKSVRITKCSHLATYTFSTDFSDATGPGQCAKTPTELNPVKENATLNPDGKRLFFFYTFGGDANDDNRPALGEIKFTVNPEDNVDLLTTERTIAEGVLRPAPNYFVTAKGGKDWISAKPGGSDITVTLSVPTDWSN